MSAHGLLDDEWDKCRVNRIDSLIEDGGTSSSRFRKGFRMVAKMPGRDASCPSRD